MESIVVSEQEINNIEALLLSNNHQFASDAREVIRCWESKDVAACPGSGKTTILLAKLKILYDRMPLENNAGVCVLYDMGGIPCVLYIECKKYDKRRPVGVKIVREVFGTLTADRVNKAVIVSTSSFSREARKFAGDQNSMIELVDLNDLLRMIRK